MKKFVFALLISLAVAPAVAQETSYNAVIEKFFTTFKDAQQIRT